MDFIPFTLIDLIDIVLVATIMYWIYRVTRGTSAPYIFSGIIAIYLLWVVTRALNMELLSSMLRRRGIPHEVLNAKHHEREAQIVAQAGKFGAVTIATNMAGRGTDIMLGGNAEFLAKSELRKTDLPDELLAECDSYAETDNPEILAIREKYKSDWFTE